MAPAAGALLWALLLSLGPRAAGAHSPTAAGLTSSTATPSASFRSRSPTARNDRPTARTAAPAPSRSRATPPAEDDDLVATADRLAGPAAAELLAATVSTAVNGSRVGAQEDGSLEEGVVINAEKSSAPTGAPRTGPSTAGGASARVPANVQEPEYRLTTSLQPRATSGSTEQRALSDTSLTQWTTAGATPSRAPRPSSPATPPPEDLRVLLMPWGPWHCHCKSGTMSRSRAGKLQGLSGRLRVGALSQLRTEHRPCTYRQCPCDRHREECPLDASPCEDAGCTSRPSPASAPRPAGPVPPLSSRLRPTPLRLPSPSPSPALEFWKRVRLGLEDIWNSLSSVFTQTPPKERNQR